jgi:hypothetical protein
MIDPVRYRTMIDVPLVLLWQHQRDIDHGVTAVGDGGHARQSSKERAADGSVPLAAP